MKDYELKTSTVIPCQAALSKALEHAGAQPVITLGLDIELATPVGISH